MKLFSFILFTGLIFSLNTFSQAKKPISGSVVDKNENTPVRMASITNISLGKTTVSRTNGTFEIEAATGHIIAFSANGFYADTLVVKEETYLSGMLLLTLRPLPSTLTNVTVVGSMSAYQMDSVERRKSFLQDVGEKPIPTVSKATDLGFGVGINLDRWSKKEKQERKARDIFEVMEEEAYVNYRWNEEVVSKYTTFKLDELIEFMDRNRPQYLWLRKNSDEEALLYYINTALKKEKKKKG
jgi:hypothetical protein